MNTTEKNTTDKDIAPRMGGGDDIEMDNKENDKMDNEKTGYENNDEWVERENAERGQGLAEYALILSLVALLAITALIFLGGAVSGILSEVGAAI